MAVIIPYGLIKPINPKADVEHCIKCLDLSARWALSINNELQYWCAHCFLSVTDWSIDNKSDIYNLVSKVESKLGRKITNDDGLLVKDEADRILMSIVILSTYLHGKNSGQSNRA